MLKSLSLTSRLTLFFTLTSTTIVLGLGVLLMTLTERHFVELDRTVLRDKQHLIEGILTSATSADNARRRLREALSHHQGLNVLVGEPGGETLYRSADFSPPEQMLRIPERVVEQEILRWNDGERVLHGLVVVIKPAYRPSAALQVMVATETQQHAQFMAQLRDSLLLYALLSIAISGVLGWLSAFKGMAPLRAMKAKATAVSGQKLDQRMPVASVPVEMADLALELNRMLDRLQEDFQRLLAFSSDLAHELRTPLSNLLTQTQVALANGRDADTYREILASNAEELQRLARMVSDMLFLAKTERGVDVPSREYFSSAEEVRALLEFYEVVAEEKRIHLSQQGNGQLLADRLMFRRALSNLLSNALRHTPAQGEVLVRIDERDGVTQVAVENTGEVIDPKALPRLFDRFYRADPARSRPENDGAGLGLAITRAIVEAHGGTISVSSTNGRTLFALRMPSTEMP